jgi:hypothetical protein
MSMDLTQSEADYLLSVPKYPENKIFPFEYQGIDMNIPLTSPDCREVFSLDIRKNRINLMKGRFQSRVSKVIVLARLDFGGAPHRNPDGQEIPSPHLHLYREGFGDKWAVELPPLFSKIEPQNMWKVLHEFAEYVNIKEMPNLKQGLLLSL